MKIKFCFAIALVCMMLTAGSAAASVITVDDAGDEDYKSIQDAVNNASDGDTIIVYPGTYTENIKVNKSVAIISGNPDDTIVQAADLGHVFYVTVDDVKISGFTVTGASEWYAGIKLLGTNNIISNNNASNNFFGIWLYESNNNTLNNNTALNNNYIGIFLNSASNNILSDNTASDNNHGIYLDGSDNTLTNNTASSNYDSGIVLCQSSNILDNNTALNNDEIGIFLISVSNNILSNNTVSCNGDGIFLEDSPRNILTNNNIVNNSRVGISLISSHAIALGNTVDSNSEYDIHSSDGNIIFNNYFNNSNNVQLDDRLREICIWNITKTSGLNIIGGPYLEGNYWAKPDGTGFSQTYTDTDDDGFCDAPYRIDENNIDYLPLSLTTFNTSAVRAFSKPIVEPGEQFTVQITASKYGILGQVEETIPPGFTFVDSTFGEWGVFVEGEKIMFPLIIGDTSFEYTLVAPIKEGTYSFSGMIKDEDRNEYLVTGDNLVSVIFQPMVYDINDNESIDKDEIFDAIKDYFDNRITKDEVFEVIKAYFN